MGGAPTAITVGLTGCYLPNRAFTIDTDDPQDISEALCAEVEADWAAHECDVEGAARCPTCEEFAMARAAVRRGATCVHVGTFTYEAAPAEDDPGPDPSDPAHAGHEMVWIGEEAGGWFCCDCEALAEASAAPAVAPAAVEESSSGLPDIPSWAQFVLVLVLVAAALYVGIRWVSPWMADVQAACAADGGVWSIGYKGRGRCIHP